MEIYNLKCPNCGATLSTNVKNKHAKCEYCSNEFIITDEAEDDLKRQEHKDDKKSKEKDSKRIPKPRPRESSADPANKKESRMRDFLIVFCIVIAGLALSLMFDKEKPQDMVPKTDMHRFFTELRPDSSPQDVEALAKKHKLHFFRTEKAVNSDTANVIYYKIAKTNETALNMKDSHAETIEAEFDSTRNNTILWAAYADPEHIVSRAVLFNYGTFRSLAAEPERQKEASGWYYYNNSLRSSPDAKGTSLPYVKCPDAAAALKKIYTFKK